jgi:peptidoglycan/xylan/chitin deacetylase (PgdA/CDA1 family)
VVLAHAGPSVAVLGQWTSARRLPGGACTWRGPDARHQVALTFDDGPSPVTTPAVLQTLADLGVPATFFCLGDQARRHPGLVRDAVHAGHQVELHGDGHAHRLLRSPRWVGRDLDRGIAALTQAGSPPAWYRPPYGQLTGPDLLAARRRGLRVVLWSCWGREWRAPSGEAVAARVRSGLAPGAVALLHDADTCAPTGTARRALEALPAIVGHLRRDGLEPVTLDRLLESPTAGEPATTTPLPRSSSGASHGAVAPAGPLHPTGRGPLRGRSTAARRQPW